jgi:hypothetical protein
VIPWEGHQRRARAAVGVEITRPDLAMQAVAVGSDRKKRGPVRLEAWREAAPRPTRG